MLVSAFSGLERPRKIPGAPTPMPSKSTIASSPTATACSSCSPLSREASKIPLEVAHVRRQDAVAFNISTWPPPPSPPYTCSTPWPSSSAPTTPCSAQRPMSTRTGIPTAATYVFINMINKLREDFAHRTTSRPVYDEGGAPVHRNEAAAQRAEGRCRSSTSRRRQFETIDYAGYKANTHRDSAGPGPAGALHPPRARSLPHPHPQATRALRRTTSSAHSPASLCRSSGHHVYIVSFRQGHDAAGQ